MLENFENAYLSKSRGRISTTMDLWNKCSYVCRKNLLNASIRLMKNERDLLKVHKGALLQE